MSTTSNYTVKRVLHRPNLSLEEGNSYDVLIESDIREEESPDTWGSNTHHVMDVVDLETGEPKQIILLAQLKIRLEEDGNYAGKMFRIQVGAIRGNNTSRDIGLYEIEATKPSK
jgi:hypothetical protein